MMKYAQADSVVFCKTKDKYGGLSNMCAGYLIEVNDLQFKTSEALYQALRFPSYPEIQKKILEAKSPMTAKMICREHISQGRTDWDSVKVSIMRWCLRAKLICNWQQFGALLESTGNLNIVELSYKDSFWGAKPICEDLVGSNVLGRLLMELRENYRTANSKSTKSTQYILSPLKLEQFKLMDKSIESIIKEFH